MKGFVGAALAVIAASAAAQGGTLPGGHPSSIQTQRAQYANAMRAQVDTLLLNWGEDLEHLNPGWIADEYSDGASITLNDKSVIARRDAIKKYYARLLQRARTAKLIMREVTEIRGGFRVSVQLVLQIGVSDAEPYEYVIPVEMDLFPDDQRRLQINTQSGGDMPIVALVGDSLRSLPLGKGDSLRVRVTTAAGIAMPNVKVAFDVFGHGTVAPDTAVTNADGVAASYFTQGMVQKPGRVDAEAAVLAGAPVSFRIRATAVAP